MVDKTLKINVFPQVQVADQGSFEIYSAWRRGLHNTLLAFRVVKTLFISLFSSN